MCWLLGIVTFIYNIIKDGLWGGGGGGVKLVEIIIEEEVDFSNIVAF